jgi:hypothetical protein
LLTFTEVTTLGSHATGMTARPFFSRRLNKGPVESRAGWVFQLMFQIDTGILGEAFVTAQASRDKTVGDGACRMQRQQSAAINGCILQI